MFAASAQAQIMPWENRTETDGDSFAQSANVQSDGTLKLKDVIEGSLINTRGDYWVLNLKTGELQQLGKGRPESQSRAWPTNAPTTPSIKSAA